MRVWAKNEEIRKLLKHPTAGGFAEDLAHPTEWPHDQFTTRRLRDGDILQQPPDEPEPNVRVRAASSAGAPTVKTEAKK